MSRRLLLPATLGLLVAASLFAVTPGVAAGDPCFHQLDNRPAPSTGSTSQVVLGDCVFTPTVNSVAVGTTVTWRNASTQAHEVVGSNMTWGAHDKLLDPGDTIGWTFETAGTYAYSCMIHPGMTGVIRVGEADTATDARDVTLASDTEAGSVDEAAGGGGTAVALAATLAGAGGLGLGLLLAGVLRRSRRPASPPLD